MKDKTCGECRVILDCSIKDTSRPACKRFTPWEGWEEPINDNPEDDE